MGSATRCTEEHALFCSQCSQARAYNAIHCQDCPEGRPSAATEADVWKWRYEQVKAELDTVRADLRWMQAAKQTAKPLTCYECATCKRIYRTELGVWDCRHGDEHLRISSSEG